MYRIAVLGDKDSVLLFRVLGLEVYFTEDASNARRTLHKLAKKDYAVIYITEQLYNLIPEDIDQYKDSIAPAIILIPGKSGSLGLGSDALKHAVERAVGADIL